MGRQTASTKLAKDLNRIFVKEAFWISINHTKRCSSLVIREMQIKATVRYHSTPTRMAKVTTKKWNDKLLARMWNTQRTLTVLVLMWKGQELCKTGRSVSWVTQSCPALCNPMDCSTPGFPVHLQHPELAQTHVHWIGYAIWPSQPLLSPSSPAFNLFQHKSLLKWVRSSHQVAKVLELQLQHQSFQWIFRTDFL